MNEPPPLLSVFVYDVVPAWPNVCNSLETEPSTSVAVNVIEPPFVEVDSEMANIPAALIVTAFEPDVFVVIVEEVPLPAPTPSLPSFVIEPSTSVAAIVTIPLSPVPVVVSAIFEPSTSWMLPPELLRVAV